MGGLCGSYIGFRFNIISIVVILCTFVGRTISFDAFIAAISGRRTWRTVVFVPAVKLNENDRLVRIEISD